ncbi:heavy-metal-associated domain-containing protein [Methylobrevis albus]|uniref:Heavy-metal-associated domain-containing protein n=1 Tax=Methylobrevis albus TaxID=2793297 RepID=A0A931MZX2_9HYPH|nr:heavy-metal-associated domain-containing protein [Methylobrevis albus]MBH0238196.1 heavy-metal-associated domain-containing protein [Methylobrevis albus]
MIELKVSGITCDGCVRTVTRVVERKAPGATVQVDRATGIVTIEGADGAAKAGEIATALTAAGYDAAA